MNTNKKILLISLILIILFGISFYVYPSLNSNDSTMNPTDIEKINDSDIYPSSQILSADNNAFYDFKQASEKLALPKDTKKSITELASGKNWDDSLATQILKDNAFSLDDFNLGSWKKGYQDPVVQDDISKLDVNTKLSSLGEIQTMAKISSIKSWMLFKEGKEKEAFDNTINIIYAGQIIENSPRTYIIEYLVGMGVKKIGIDNLQSLTANTQLNSIDLKNYITKIDKFKNNKEGLQEAFKTEYVSVKNTKEQLVDKYFYDGNIQEMKKNMRLLTDTISLESKDDSYFSNFYYNPNETQKLFYETYQKFIDNSSKDCKDIQPTQISMPSEAELLTTKNAIGKVFSKIIDISFNSIFKRRCQEEFSIIKTQLLLAIKAYEIDNGKYPDSLDQLYPDYLNTAQKQFDGKNIIYSPETGIISLSE